MFLPIADENTYVTRPVVNYALIGLNVLAYVILAPGPGAGALTWTEGLLFVLLNLLFLWITGDNVEAAFGRGRYVAFYGVCCVLAVLLGPSGEKGWPAPLVGTTGALFGVLGAYVFLHPTNPIRFWYSWYYRYGTVQVQAVYAIGGYLALIFLYGITVGDFSHIPYSAPVTGFAAGMGVAYLAHQFGWLRKERPHAWIRAPSSSRPARQTGEGERDASPGPGTPGPDHPILPRVPRRVHVRALGHQPKGMRIKDPNACFVIRSDESPIDVHRAGQLLAAELGCPLADATSLIGTTKGFLTREVPRDRAERLAAALVGEGVPALVVPCKDLEQLPRSILLRRVRVHANGIEARTEWEEFSILWQEIRLVSCGRIRTEKTIRKARSAFQGDPRHRPSIYPGAPLGPMGRSATEKVYRDEIVIDLFHTDPMLRFRFWEGRFGLDDAGGPVMADRMKELARRIVENASGPFLSPGVTALAQGKELSGYSFGSRSSYENYNRYLFLLERNAPDVLRGGRARWLEI